MSDLPRNDNDPEKEAGEEGSSASVAGKGWDILVGGKDNPYAAGGSDPFDISAAASAASADVRAKDAETDAILKSVSEQPAPVGANLPPDAAFDKGRGAEAPRDLGPQDLGVPGVSPGVTVMPIGGVETPTPVPSGPVEITEVAQPGTGPLNSSAITEITQPETPQVSPSAPAMLPVFPPASSASGSGITEVSAPPAPSLSPFPDMPVPASASPMPSMPIARSVPAGNPAAPVPFVPGLSLSQSGGYASAISDPFASQTDIPLKLVQQDLPPDPVLEKQLITTARINALWSEINETYDLVINDVRGHFNTTEDGINELARARELLVSGTANFDEAEQVVKEVKARLRLEEKVRQWSVARGTWLATYLIMWFPLLGLAVFLSGNFNKFAARFIPEFLSATYLPSIFGVLGGVIGALWILNQHMTKKRDFDPIHTMWYVTNPFLGGALGVVTYFIVRGGGLIVVQAGGNENFRLTDLMTIILCGLCVIVGFNQNILWSLVNRFLKAIIPETKEDQIAVTDTPSYTSTLSSGPSGTTTTTSTTDTAPPSGG